MKDTVESQTPQKTPLTAAVWGWLLRVVSSFNFKFWVAMTCIVSLFIASFCCVRWAIKGFANEVEKWAEKIDDPTERGCVYIALSILVFSFVIVMKNFATEKIKITKED